MTNMNLQYVNFHTSLPVQVAALQMMGGNHNASTASMWTQCFKVVRANWSSYHHDQRRPKPLMSSRMYLTKMAKTMPPITMRALLKEVREFLHGLELLFFFALVLLTVRDGFIYPAHVLVDRWTR